MNTTTPSWIYDSWAVLLNEAKTPTPRPKLRGRGRGHISEYGDRCQQHIHNWLFLFITLECQTMSLYSDSLTAYKRFHFIVHTAESDHEMDYSALDSTFLEAKFTRSRPSARGRVRGRGQLVEATKPEAKTSRPFWPRGFNITCSWVCARRYKTLSQELFSLAMGRQIYRDVDDAKKSRQHACGVCDATWVVWSGSVMCAMRACVRVWVCVCASSRNRCAVDTCCVRLRHASAYSRSSSFSSLISPTNSTRSV